MLIYRKLKMEKVQLKLKPNVILKQKIMNDKTATIISKRAIIDRINNGNKRFIEKLNIFLDKRTNETLTLNNIKNFKPPKKQVIITKKPPKYKRLDYTIIIRVQISQDYADRPININKYLGIDNFLTEELLKIEFIDEPTNIYEAETIRQYIDTIDYAERNTVQILDREINGQANPSKRDLTQIIMTRQNNIRIDKLVSEKIIHVESKDGKCVRDALLIVNPTLKKHIEETFNNNTGYTINDIIEFSEKHKFKAIGFTIDGDIIKQTDDKLTYSHKLKTFRFIQYDNHIYIVDSRKSFKRVKNIKDDLVYKRVDDIKEKFYECINNGGCIQDIKRSNSTKNSTFAPMTSFICDNICYFVNDEYDYCTELLKRYGLEEYQKYDTTSFNIVDIIHFNEKKVGTTPRKPKSFLPINYNKAPLHYQVKTINNNRNIIKIDINKAYRTALKNLNHLITVDIRQHQVENIYNGCRDINPYNLYIIEPIDNIGDLHKFLIPSSGIYDGEYLKMCIERGCESFKILQCIKGNRESNIYNNIDEEKLKAPVGKCKDECKVCENCKHNQFYKDIYNIHIGKLCRNITPSYKREFIKLGHADELNTNNDENVFIQNIDDDYGYCYKKTMKTDIYNSKPVHFMIMDRTNMKIYDKIIKLGLTINDIVDIRTDSLSFYYDSKFINTDTEWKVEEGKITKRIITKPPNYTHLKLIQKENDNYLEEGYAGCGKTHKIINEIIPKLEGKKYQILCPSNDTLIDYRKVGFNSDNSKVYQYYQFNEIDTTLDVIICDEIGLFDRTGWNTIYKYYLNGTKIMCFGDFKQMLPVKEDSPFNNRYFLDSIFETQTYNYENHRNNFKIEYYDSLINSTDVNYLKQEIRKYSNDSFKDAEKTICFQNKFVDKYNNLKLEHLGFKSMFEIGVEVVCNTSKLGYKSIYNKSKYIISGIDGNEIILKDILGEVIVLKKGIVSMHFKPSYSMTIYGVQGKTLKSYFYPDEKDFIEEYHIDGRMAYTLISRLKK